MKHTASTSLAALAVSFLLGSPAFAALNFSAGYGGAEYYTHSNSDNLHSYDWGSDGNLYYATATPSFTSGGFYRFNGTTTSTLAGASGDFSGTSVVAVGSSIFYNDGNFPVAGIYRHDVGSSGAPVETAVGHYALGSYGGNLLTTGAAGFGQPTHINYYSGGDLGSTIDLGVVAATSSPGPLVFDGAGNLYYAPGFGDSSIYRWSAAEVAAAISSNGVNGLTADGHLWVAYGATSLGIYSGASSLLVDENGDVLVSLTNFSDPSLLVKFDGDGSGDFTTILESTDRLGDLRSHDGEIYISNANQILQIVPEPSSLLLTVMAGGAFLRIRRRA